MLICYNDYMSLHPATPEESYDNFQNGIESLKPHLFNLADQLVEASQDAKWNVLVVDDTSARLPAHFVRKVLSRTGCELPTYFVAGSHSLHERIGDEPYHDRFRQIQEHVGGMILNPLIITEVIGTGKAAQLLKRTAAPVSENVEIATVANHFDDVTEADYIGVEGAEGTADVFYTLEVLKPESTGSKATNNLRLLLPTPVKKLIPKSLRKVASPVPTNALIGLHFTDQEVAIAKRNPNNPYTAKAYKYMHGLVNEYFSSRDVITNDVSEDISHYTNV